MVNLHIENEHKAEDENKIYSALKQEECPMCKNKFLSDEDFASHMQGHLEEIRNIDIEYLKICNEIFPCSLCKFQLNDSETVKSHLAKTVCYNKKTLIKKSRIRETLNLLTDANHRTGKGRGGGI